MLKIENLHAEICGKPILKGLNLTINPGEIHAIMGPNGAGKSTLSYILSGREGYNVISGAITFQGKNLLDLKPEERAGAGLFLAFQYPVEIPGVSNSTFLKQIVNSVRKYRGETALEPMKFVKLMRNHAQKLGLNNEMLKRAVNMGFSGGEKKRNEILQMAMLDPSMCILDETDSGLDIDALRIVSEGVNLLRSKKRSMLVITHYQRVLDYIVPDYVHVLTDGQIVKTGSKELAFELEKNGYTNFNQAVA